MTENETDAPRGHHDMGGLPAGPVELSEHHVELWEKRIDAIITLLSGKDYRVIRVDELRRGIESLPPDAYDTMSYYERWIASVAAILVEKGIMTQAEIDARIDEIAAREEPLP
ncbi:MAG: hypothetical protein ACYSXF_05910 [Planctomycetota bacterium]